MAQLRVNGYRDQDGEFINADKSYPRGATRTAAYTASSARTGTDFTSGCAFVELYATTNCWYKFGSSSVTAATTDNFLPANTRLIVPTGGQARVAAIQDAAGGTLFATELGVSA